MLISPPGTQKYVKFYYICLKFDLVNIWAVHGVKYFGNNMKLI
jgi:hypothetical protein